MAIRVITGGSVSANYHVHVVRGQAAGNVSASSGYSNERTFAIPVETRDARITVKGAYGSVSGSANLAVDIGPKGSAYVNLFSISGDFTSVVPVQVDHVLRFRLANGASVSGTSVDVWIG